MQKNSFTRFDSESILRDITKSQYLQNASSEHVLGCTEYYSYTESHSPENA